MLARLERAQSRRPAPFVRVLHQLVHDVRRTAALDERALDDCLQHGVRRRDHASPARDARRLQRRHPPAVVGMTVKDGYEARSKVVQSVTTATLP